jgi:hypothetical protein
MTELQALNNAANDMGLTVYERLTQDKRRTVKQYFAQNGNETISPILDYEQLNCWLLGYRKAIKYHNSPVNY